MYFVWCADLSLNDRFEYTFASTFVESSLLKPQKSPKLQTGGRQEGREGEGKMAIHTDFLGTNDRKPEKFAQSFLNLGPPAPKAPESAEGNHKD